MVHLRQLRTGSQEAATDVRGDSAPASDAPPTVVIEHEDPAWQWAVGKLLQEAGYEVVACRGPRHLPGHECSLVTDDRCPLVDSADVVVNGLNLHDGDNREVLVALRNRRPHTPVVVEVPDPEVEELNAAIPGCRTVRFPVLSRELVGAVDAALTAPDQPGASASSTSTAAR